MSEYYFAVFTGVQMTNGKSIAIRGGKRTATKRNRIAREIDSTAGYYYYFDSARKEWRGWGYVKNRGTPFNESVSAKISAAWDAAGVGS